MELPPRARRIPLGFACKDGETGTTSACAENTSKSFGWTALNRNYLRVRGEYSLPSFNTEFALELPPRARRIRRIRSSIPRYRGTTSACAENTGGNQHFDRLAWNYLRMRGEYELPGLFSITIPELPPHARRIRRVASVPGGVPGTTSACAENTPKPFGISTLTRNYLRMRGEYRWV